MLMLQKSDQSQLSFFPAHRKARLCTDSQPIVLLVQHDPEMRDSRQVFAAQSSQLYKST